MTLKYTLSGPGVFAGCAWSVADLRDARDVCPLSIPKFLHFHVVFRENWSNSMLGGVFQERFQSLVSGLVFCVRKVQKVSISL